MLNTKSTKMNIFLVICCCCGIIAIKGENEMFNILDFCDDTLQLSDNGPNSSISLSLELHNNNPCRIKIQAPVTHLIYIRVLDNENLENPEISACPINIYAKNANICQELLPNKIEIELLNNESTKQILITAIGTGEFCLKQEQFSCLQSGWSPLLCISKWLLCNGVVNCPAGALLSDENHQLCKETNNWEKIADDFLTKFSGKPDGLLPAIRKNVATTPATDATSSDLSPTFAEFGPWGYLMLGMLICGTVLTFCGLWECCCRKSKPQVRAPEVEDSGAVSTVILVTGAGPPEYEELEQPPSYNVLFPEKGLF